MFRKVLEQFVSDMEALQESLNNDAQHRAEQHSQRAQKQAEDARSRFSNAEQRNREAWENSRSNHRNPFDRTTGDQSDREREHTRNKGKATTGKQAVWDFLDSVYDRKENIKNSTGHSEYLGSPSPFMWTIVETVFPRSEDENEEAKDSRCCGAEDCCQDQGTEKKGSDAQKKYEFDVVFSFMNSVLNLMKIDDDPELIRFAKSRTLIAENNSGKSETRELYNDGNETIVNAIHNAFTHIDTLNSIDFGSLKDNEEVADKKHQVSKKIVAQVSEIVFDVTEEYMDHKTRTEKDRVMNDLDSLNALLDE